MAEISWIKLKTTMFDDEKIRLIQAIPESDAILVIWIRLLVLAGKTNDDGLIYIQRNMPYTDEMLATLFGKPVNTIRLALQTLENFNMIDLGDDGAIAIINWEKHQNIEGMEKVREQNRLRKAKQREKQRMLPDVTGTSRDSHATDIDIDKEIDKEKDKEKDKDIGDKPAKRKKRVYAIDDPYYQLADKLYQAISANQDIREPNINQWADDIRKTIEIDKRSVDQVENMIDWATKDTFWSGVILSAKKLREKYDTMKAQANRAYQSNQQQHKNRGGRPYKTEKLTDWDSIAPKTPVDPEMTAELDRRMAEFLKYDEEEKT